MHDLKRAFCTIFMEKSVLYNFHEKRTVFPFWRASQASQKRAPHDLERQFCTIFIKSALFSLFEETLRPVWRFWEVWPSKMRFGQNVLRMTWKERFVQFSWKAHCFPVLARIWSQCNDFENFNAQKCDFAKTCCAWLRKCVSCFILAKPAKNRLLRQKRLYFRKSCSKWQNGQNGIILAKSSQNCVLAEMALFWQNMLKTVVLAKMACFFRKSS